MMQLSVLIYSLSAAVICVSSAHGFNPNNAISWQGRSSSASYTHKSITEMAVRKMAKLYMDDHPDVYKDQDKALATVDFKQALMQFTSGAVKPDVEDNLQRLPEAHFDDEQIEQSMTRLREERIKVCVQI